MSKIVKNTIIYALGRILPQAVNFVLLPFYTDYLSPTEYGIVESMLVLCAVLSIIFSMGTERSMFRVYYDYRNEEEKKKFVGNTAIMIAVNATFFLILAFLLGSFISRIYSEIPFNPYFVYAITISYVTAFAYVPQTLLQVQEDAMSFFIVSVASFLAEIGFIVYFVILEKQGAEGLLKGKLIGHFIMLPVYIYITKKKSIFSIDRTIIRNILLFSLPMLPSLLMSWVMNMSNRIFIENYFTLEEVGLFSVAFKISSVATILLGAMFTAYNPMFYRLASEGAKHKIQKNNNMLVLVIFSVGIFTTLFAKDVILILNERYYVSVNYVPMLVLSVILNFLAGIFSLMIYQNKRSDTMMWIYVFSAIINLLSNWLLVSQYGAYGASWATVVTALIVLIVSIVYAKKNYYIPLRYNNLLILSVITIGVSYFSSVMETSWHLFGIKIILLMMGLGYFCYKKWRLKF
ncbi:lipopolysaccharide biosynthesis protein [Capnocytophaga felis]|uniref:lipopolysaccharide biosynthesis protein n=1 Tax=Capnocytophaga felis TaxID=2267611 RepID=UPI001565D805|nr:oligosaccharide flippase family protein [Capnocytophaga felis]